MKMIKFIIILICFFSIGILVANVLQNKNASAQSQQAPTNQLALGKPQQNENAKNGLSPSQQAQIEKVIHDYLIANPEVLVEASHALQQKEIEDMQKMAIKATRGNAKKLLDAPLSPVEGNPKGSVTLIAFLDYQCTHCRAMADIIDKLMKMNPNLRVIFKEFPIFGPDSTRAARAALAANLQKKYFALHQVFMNSQIPFSQTNIINMAKKVGLDSKQLLVNMKLKSISRELEQNYQLAQALKLIGTPVFIITASNLDQDPKLPVAFFPGQTSQNQLQQMIDEVGK
ncbi:MAG: DsbA family protein [Gammaproteobacteria bacterium]|nr:DsbA family protein [Gammaproteobacteria bacterium]